MPISSNRARAGALMRALPEKEEVMAAIWYPPVRFVHFSARNVWRGSVDVRTSINSNSARLFEVRDLYQ
jgi:hypothetical protein